jgi:hypothetical protein
MANRVGGDFFDDFAVVAKTAATPQELNEIIGALNQVLETLEGTYVNPMTGTGDDPELSSELDELHLRVEQLKESIARGTYGKLAAAKLKPIVAALLESAINYRKTALGDPSEPIDMTDMHDIEMSQIPEPSTEWEVIVGNVGTVYSGPNEDEARSVYSEYEMGRGGRATGEPITLMHDGEIVEEYPGEEWESYPDDPMTDEEFNTPNTITGAQKTKFATFIRTAAITVAQGQDEQGFHMLVNMNGREYVLRGNDAENFRKEYAAIAKPEVKVNALVEKYMNALRPYKKQSVPVAPGVLEKEQQENRAKGLADADNYWQGKGAPTTQEEKRYMTQHASHRAAQQFYEADANRLHPEGCKCTSTNGGGDCDWCQVYYNGPGDESSSFTSASLVAAYVEHYQENRGQDPDAVPLTGSAKTEHKSNEAVSTPMATTNGEFSDLGGSKPDLSKLGDAAAPAPALEKSYNFQEGDEVRANLGAGSMLRGEIVAVNGDKVDIKSMTGKVFKDIDIAKVHSSEEVEEQKNQNIHQVKEELQHKESPEGKKQDRVENSVAMKANGSPGQMVPELQRRGYSLTVKYKGTKPQYLQQAEQEYADWTGGDQLPDESVKPYDTMYGREWTLVYTDPERSMPVFFDVEPMGIHEGKRSPEPIGLSQRDRVVVNYPEIVGELVKAGLRCTTETQEVRTSSMVDTKKACGDNCAEVDEEVTLPASIEVEGQGGKSLPPAETAVETDKEAGFNFFFPGQVLKEFYPEVQHEIVDYPNDNNAPMIEDIDLDSAMERPILSYVQKTGYASTSPAAGAGIGRDGKEQVLEGAPLRNEGDIRGGMFMDEFHQQYNGVPGALLALAAWKPKTAGDEKAMFGKFLKYVCAEIAATMVAMFKTTSRPILNGAPGVGEVQLAQVEQPNSLSSFNIVNTGSRVKYLLEKINDGDIKEAINGARAQAAVWVDDPNGGFVYEVFVRAESIDTDSMIMKYTFVTGTKESE